ncbi:MAG TPA: hypothetical protein VFM65_03985 [Flavobacteriaceae bacterium]|nr:hypothetical protein [Flavobacteriaceae bacterium]
MTFSNYFKNHLCKSSFLLMVCVFLFSSCEPENFQPSTNQEKANQDYQTYSREASELDHYYLKKKFALALHQAMIQNVALREFLKNEALKKFDGDYDILYNYVKNKNVDGSTFRELLLPFFENKGELNEIENTIEALTIFIPSLPQGSFSAEIWNTSEEVPLVAIKLLNNEKTPIINSQGQSYLFDDNVIPSFPVIVIKECERITVPGFSGYDSNNNREYVSENGFRFKFSNPAFDFINVIEITDGTPQDLIDAWEVNGKHQNIGWQRDYLYYTISQANSTGPYINTYSEYLKDFRLEGPPLSALNNIAQNSSVNSNLSDPTLNFVEFEFTDDRISQGSFWTDGDFEFNVYLEYDVNQPPLEKAFFANPEDLFNLQYDTVEFGPFYLYFVVDIETRTLPVNLPMLPWRLNDYSNEWKLTFEEQDLNVVVKTEESYQSTFNANFNFSVEVKKVGAEFGASAEQTHTSSITREYTEESDDLESAKVHFGDNVIIDEGSTQFSFFWIHFDYTYYELRRYSTGKCSFSLTPLEVQ